MLISIRGSSDTVLGSIEFETEFLEAPSNESFWWSEWALLIYSSAGSLAVILVIVLIINKNDSPPRTQDPYNQEFDQQLDTQTKSVRPTDAEMNTQSNLNPNLETENDDVVNVTNLNSQNDLQNRALNIRLSVGQQNNKFEIQLIDEDGSPAQRNGSLNQ